MLDRTTQPQVDIYENLNRIARKADRKAVIDAIEQEIAKLTGSLFALEPDKPAIDFVAKFELFWKVRTKRRGADPKVPAFKVFMQFVKRGANPDDIVEGARICALSSDPNFSPQMTRWLREQRWRDYVKTTSAQRAAIDPKELRRQELIEQMKASGHI
jgi:hypothetical protein